MRSALGAELVGLEYEGPFDELPAQAGVTHRVIPWEDVSLTEGTGIVHIAPGAGTEDFELSRVHDLPVLAPIDDAGRMVSGYGQLEGMSTSEVEGPVVEWLSERGLLVEAGRITHRYPICWRCGTPLVFRVVDDWFISCAELRQPLLDANATVEWTPPQYGKRMDDWLRNMGDWNISRKRYFGLPLPLYPCTCGKLNVVGSKAELEERAVSGLDELQELHRPWIDEVRIRCEDCEGEVERIPEVGDAWLDAGIVPFSTLGWQSPEWRPGGYANGASTGLSGADLPDHAYWEKWYPADWVSESREQIRLWFYSQCFMSVTLVGRSPYRRVLAYERVRDETGREMHKSWGNAIEANEAFSRMGADIVRWLFSAQAPSQNVNFGYGPADEVRRRLLTLWNSVKFLVDYANIGAWSPAYGALAARAVRRARSTRPLARGSDESAGGGGDGRLRELVHPRRRSGVRGVRRGRLELVHPPLETPLLGRRRDGIRGPLVRARTGPAGRLSADAVSRGSPLAGADEAGRGCAGFGLPGRLARAGRAGRCAPRRGGGRAPRRRSRAPGAVGGGHQAPPAAARPRGRGSGARARARG